MPEMWSVGSCPTCKTGPLGLRVCGGCERLVLLCDECDTARLTLDANSAQAAATDDTMPCPDCGESLWEEGSRWATEEEALAEPWLLDAVNAGEVTLERGAAFDRESFGDAP